MPAVSQTLNSSSTLSQAILTAACQELLVPHFTHRGSNAGMLLSAPSVLGPQSALLAG